MAQALTVVRTKGAAADDGDPTDGVFTPPEAEIWKPAGTPCGYYVAVNYGALAGIGRLRVYARDAGQAAAMPNIVTWKLMPGADVVLPQGQLFVASDSFRFELWFRLTGIVGAMPPITVLAAEVP